MVAAIIVKVAQVDERVSEAELVTDIAANLLSFQEIGERLFVLSERSLDLRHAVDA